VVTDVTDKKLFLRKKLKTPKKAQKKNKNIKLQLLSVTSVTNYKK